MTEPNTLFPGRPNYTGPDSGYGAFIHHGELFEATYSFKERLVYIDNYKPKSERAIRCWNMMYLPFVTDALYADYLAKRNVLYADYEAKRGALNADYLAKRNVLNADYAAKRGALDADYAAKRGALNADYAAKRGALDADYAAKRGALDADYAAKWDALYADYVVAKWDVLYADYAAKRDALPLAVAVLAFVKMHNPDCPWNGKELVFE